MKELIEGIYYLKKGAMLNLVAIGLMFISLLYMGLTVGFVNPEDPNAFLLALSAMGSLIFAIVVSVILSIIGFIIYFKATGHLKNYNRELGIGRTGMVLQIVGIALIFLPLLFLTLAIATKSEGLVAVAVGFILLAFAGVVMIIVGAVFFGIMLLRLGDVDSGFKTAGIIYLVGMVLSFVLGVIGQILGIISTYLIYSSSKRFLEAKV